MNKNRKALQEVTSHILLLAIVIIVSIIIYNLSKNYIDNTLASKEEELQKENLLKLSYLLNEINFFPGEKRTFILSFKEGLYIIEPNSIYYISGRTTKIPSSETICKENICEYINNYEIYYFINLSSINITLNTTEKYTLSPETYILNLESKDGKINLQFK